MVPEIEKRKENNMDAGLLSMYVALMLLGLGMIVFSKFKIEEREAKMSTGLFIMIGLLLLLAAGIFIYAKIDDRKEQKRTNDTKLKW